MIVDADGWMSMEPGEDVDDFIGQVVNARPALTDAEIVRLRAIFRPVCQQLHRQEGTAA